MPGGPAWDRGRPQSVHAGSSGALGNPAVTISTVHRPLSVTSRLGFPSRDLVSWRQIGNAIDRPVQVDYGEGELTRGLSCDAALTTACLLATPASTAMRQLVITAKDPRARSDPLAKFEARPVSFLRRRGSAGMLNTASRSLDALRRASRIWLQVSISRRDMSVAPVLVVAADPRAAGTREVRILSRTGVNP